MRVVVSALQYDARPAGVGQYIAHLVAAYTQEFPEDTVTALVPRGQALVGAQLVELIPSGLSSARRLWFEHTRLARTIRAVPHDVVHFPDYQRPRGEVGPAVVTVHDLAAFLHPETFPKRTAQVKRTLMRMAVRRARRIIVPSFAIQQDLVACLRVPADTIAVVPHGVAAPPVLGPLPAAPPYFLYVGTLEPRKNLVRLVEAYRRLAQDHPDVPDLRLIGGRGWLVDPILAALGRAGSPGRIIEMGYVGREDLWGWLHGAVAFCYPSLYEGFGLPILEAMAAGTPVLTANCGATAEVAGDAAVLVDPLRVDAMADGMRRLWQSPDADRARAIQQGRERAAAFTWERTAHATRQVYQQAAGLQ